MRKRRGNPYSWQLHRLLEFADYETEESRIYEMFYEKTAQKVPFQVLSVMIFFLKELYRTKPGSLVTLYRVSRAPDVRSAEFMKRYEKYYEALQERGFM